MASSSGVACLEVFDENSQPSVEEISEYAQQIGIDPDSESHLLPIAKDGLMQALPPSWRAYYDEKLQTHYYYNEESKKTQWEHPLDNVYREIVQKARDASMLDDTYVSVQELLTSEENTKQLERIETKVGSDEELSTDSENNSENRELPSSNVLGPRRLAPLGRPPLAPLKPLDKKLHDLRISPLRRSLDGPVSFKPNTSRPMPDKDISRILDRPELFKQQSEIIDLKMHVSNNEEESFNLFGKGERVLKMGLPLTGKGSIFLKGKKAELSSPDTDKSMPIDSTKSDPPKGILREKVADAFYRKVESLSLSKPRQAVNFEDDKKSVRFKLENTVEPTISPGSNSSSELHEGQSSIISAAPVTPQTLPSSVPFTSSNVPMPSNVVSNMPIVLSPIVARPPLPPRPLNNSDQSPRDKSVSGSEKESLDTSSKRRLLRPPAADYINQDLFQKNFHKIADLLQDQGDIQGTEVPVNKEIRPRSPMMPQMNKISINLMESIESETSTDSPDREFAILDLNDMDDAKIEMQPDKNSDNKDSNISSPKEEKEISEIFTNSSINKSSKNDDNPVPKIQVPKLDFLSKPLLKPLMSELEDPKNKTNLIDSKTNSRSDSIEIHKNIEPKILSPTLKSSPNHSYTSDVRSPKTDSNYSPWSSFKPGLNKAIISPQLKSESNTSLSKSSRLDGVIISQGKNVNNGSDNVVVMYQFEQPEESKISRSIKSSSELARDMIERSKVDEKRRLELSMQKELEEIRVQWTVRERKMRAELQDELKENEARFQEEKTVRLLEQEEKHRKEMKKFNQELEQKHSSELQSIQTELEERRRIEVEKAENEFKEDLARLKEKYAKMLAEERRELESENERALSEMREQLQVEFHNARARVMEENRGTLEALREEQKLRIEEMKQDYRAEMDRLRSAHSCHVSEVRARLSRERAAANRTVDTTNLQDKYRCLKEKYARLKHDVKMSIERRNKRREMSMTTGSETEKSNSHKATQSLEKKEQQEQTAVIIETVADIERPRNVVYVDTNVPSYNDNETSLSDYNAQRSSNNNNVEWNRIKTQNTIFPESSRTEPARRRTTVAFKEPPRRNRREHKQKDKDGTTTDFHDSSDATTTADEKPKENVNGHGRRRCFTRLKSASTSRLNYSPKRGEGWSSPLESLRQQLRKLDDLEDQFPDMACQPSYSLRYPFAELGPVTAADTPELEFVRHRALIEREGMRRARAALRRRRTALRETRALSQNAPSEEREVTELEVALHRARALLGEKEIRLQHIERALRQLADKRQTPVNVQEATTSSASSSESGTGEAGLGVLRSLRALHADVRDIWRALDARRPVVTASPETSSCNTANMPGQPRTSLSAQDTLPRQSTDAVTERARGLRAWLQTAP